MGIMSTGTSGLLAFQRALATTSHNISNSTKDGYSRQRVSLEARNPQMLGGNFYGQGVQISSVRRMQDEFVDVQLRNSISDAANGEVRAEYAERIDRLLGDASTGLAPAMRTFFNAANDVSSDPTSTTARTVFLGEAESMVQRFGELNSRIEEQRTMINKDIKLNVDEINALAESLKDLNSRIVEGYGAAASQGGAPNDLLDERGRVLGELAKRIDIKTLEQEDRSVNVFIGNGQPLVIGGVNNSLTVGSMLGDIRNYGIGFKTAGGQSDDITKFMTGGELGGLLEIREQVLDSAQNGIGQIAVVLSTTMNQQNNLGLDLNGETGEDIFSSPDLYVGAVPGNGVAGHPTVTFNEGAITDLTASDYILKRNAGNFELLRLSDNEIVKTGALGSEIQADGLIIDTTAIAGAADKDEWIIQPTRFAAERIGMEMVNPEKVAAAAGATVGPDNTGSARMMDLRRDNPAPANPENVGVPAAVLYTGGNFDVYSPEYGAPNNGSSTVEGFKITDAASFVSGAVTYDGTNKVFNVGATAIPLDPSGTTTINADGWEMKIRGVPVDTASFNITQQSTTAPAANQPPPTIVTGYGWELDVFGTPAEGDTFGVELKRGREGDNRNMLSLAGLAEQPMIEDSESFADSYNSTLGLVGTRTRQAQVFRDSSIALRDQAQVQRDQISGVNLDEEAANLLKYQQAYQAAAQAISVGNRIFDSLFAAIGR
ncbi:flagellar hook-associated protein FlgK [Thiorhodovibrio frisius]|uniref:Flagellar hook-associated protein 1 n=1 Tax=Thiorhodovibrio frisius TaxID=631362 RepID=H8YZQ1_9GAMM|nr:flagellar hook-associated protein FlgK [Thiorhodovibrio frisius]EIC22178.1 flagellar hook-associated protein FlgK [Thiorhodovibrio frisius]WPL24472.1 Flagellar hook-associated protein 1 [Thiorhodovibrio frisius]